MFLSELRPQNPPRMEVLSSSWKGVQDAAVGRAESPWARGMEANAGTALL